MSKVVKPGWRRRKYKNRWAKRARRYGGAYWQLSKDVSRLKDAINVEYKLLEHKSAAQSVNNAGTFVLMNGSQKGDDYNSRDGRQIRIKSFYFNAKVTIHPSAVHTVFRVMLLIDTQPTGVAPILSQILRVGTVANILCMRNLDNRKRFSILRDFRINLNQDYPEKYIKVFRRLDMKTIYDDSNAGDITDISSNALYMLFISEEVADNFPTIEHVARVRFIDN